MNKIITISDARDQKVTDADRKAFIDDKNKKAEESRKKAFLKANPDVGTLVRNGKDVYYTFSSGKYVEINF